MSDGIMDPEQLAEIASGYATKNSTWAQFVESAVDKIIQRYVWCLLYDDLTFG